MVQQQEEGCYRGTQAERDTYWPTGSQLLFYFFQLVSRTPARLTSSVSLLWLHPLRPFLRLATPICCPKQETRGAFDGSVATARPSSLPHTSLFLAPFSILPPSSFGCVTITPSRWIFFFFLFLLLLFQHSRRQGNLDGRGENGNDRLKINVTPAMGPHQICCQSISLPSLRPSSSSPLGFLLDLLPHTISTDHAHYVFNSSILCKTGQP